MNNLLEIEKVSFKIQDKSIFKDLSFSVAQGEVVLLKGTSGSGKSSLVHVILGIFSEIVGGEITGSIRAFGEDIRNRKLCDLSTMFGYLMQDPETQLCTFYVKDELLFGMENLNWEREKMHTRLQEIVSLFSLEELLHRPLNELSGGQKQKVAFASIVATDPDIYLLDEPTANLDPIAAKEILDIVKKLADKGKTILLIEHNLQNLHDVIDKIFDMDRKVWIEDHISQHLEDYRKENTLPKVFHQPQDQVIMQVSGLCFSYGKDPLLRDISFRLKKGEILGIVGHNGAGKSTLANLLSGLRKDYEGSILVDSKEIKEMTLKTIGQTVGLVFQNPEHQFVKNTVEEELAVGLTVRGKSEEEVQTEVERYLQLFQLIDKKNNNPFQLSQGEKRKLSTADMLITGQHILILDEPTYGQDRYNLANLLRLLYRIAAQGVAIVIISHDREVICNSCHHVMKLENGKVGYYGNVQEFVQREPFKKCESDHSNSDIGSCYSDGIVG